MNPRLLQGFNFDTSQGLDELSIIDELVCGISILCIHIIERPLGAKILSYQARQRQVGGLH